jgi:hypothetical protein
MIGKIRCESISYRQFCHRVRKLMASDKELYAEWNRCLKREGNIDYAHHAARIAAKRRRDDDE